MGAQNSSFLQSLHIVHKNTLLRKMVVINGKNMRKTNNNNNSKSEDIGTLDVLGWDLTMKIFSLVDARSLAQSLLVSHHWSSLASNDSLWSPLCEQLWVGKSNILKSLKMPASSMLARYSRAANDGKRVNIMKEDLCDHSWSFRFNEVVSEYWKNIDPYWGGTGPPMHRYFHLDGSQTADSTDEVWGGHECSYTVIPGVVDDGIISNNYVKVNSWLRLSVSRREDWGWDMSNIICTYSNKPDLEIKGGTGTDVSGSHLVCPDVRLLTMGFQEPRRRSQDC